MQRSIRPHPTMFMLLCAILIQMVVSVPAHALIPSQNNNHRYINPDGSYSYYTGFSKDGYVKNTLPNEWLVSWDDDALRAGAIIIRSGVFWRVNRSVLNSPLPNNNCLKGTSPGGIVYYVTVPNTRGGFEQWLPNSTQTKTNNAVDAVPNFHMELSPMPSGRPDALIMLSYNSTIQQRTQDNKGTWSERYRYAYVGQGSPGAPFDPNQQCNQSDDQNNSNPAFANT